MKTEQEQIEAATMAIAREVCPYYNRGRCDLGSPTCHKTSIQLCSRKEAIIDSLNRIVKQAKIDVLNELKEKCKFDGHTVAVYKNDIDELIKEVQNES
jgi:hypothetical protein